MKDQEKIIEFLLKKYGYASLRKKGYIKSRYPSGLNKRIRKAIEHFLLFYDEDKERLSKENKEIQKKQKDYQKWIYDFLCKNGLEDKYKKECLKELIV